MNRRLVNALMMMGIHGLADVRGGRVPFRTDALDRPKPPPDAHTQAALDKAEAKRARKAAKLAKTLPTVS